MVTKHRCCYSVEKVILKKCLYLTVYDGRTQLSTWLTSKASMYPEYPNQYQPLALLFKPHPWFMLWHISFGTVYSLSLTHVVWGNDDVVLQELNNTSQQPLNERTKMRTKHINRS